MCPGRKERGVWCAYHSLPPFVKKDELKTITLNPDGHKFNLLLEALLRTQQHIEVRKRHSEQSTEKGVGRTRLGAWLKSQEYLE